MEEPEYRCISAFRLKAHHRAKYEFAMQRTNQNIRTSRGTTYFYCNLFQDPSCGIGARV